MASTASNFMPKGPGFDFTQKFDKNELSGLLSKGAPIRGPRKGPLTPSSTHLLQD